MTFDQPMEVFRGTSLIIKSIIIYKGGEGRKKSRKKKVRDNLLVE